MSKLYENIRARRMELGITQQELADMLGYKSGKSMIAKIEKGKVDLPQSKIKEFAVALQTTQSDLMGWEGNEETVKIAIELADAVDKYYEERTRRRLMVYYEKMLELKPIQQKQIIDMIAFFESKNQKDQ